MRGSPQRDFVIVGSYNTNIPLPKGEWALVGYDTRDNELGTRVNYLVLAQNEDGKLAKFIAVFASDENHPWGYTADNFCERDDVLHIVKRSNSAGGNQNCRGINHWSMTLGSKSATYWKQAFRHWQATNLEIPVNALVVVFLKANDRSFVQVTYGFNPELDGFSPPAQATWLVSDWHKDRYYTDKRKVTYVEMLKSWGEKWDSTVDDGFAGKLPVSAAQSHAARLATLRELLDNGTISQQEFDKKKQEILGTL